MTRDAYGQIIDALSGKKRVLVTTHVRPDGDALGTAAAMAMGLAAKGIDSLVLLLSHVPRRYAFIFNDNPIKHLDVEAGWPADFSLDGFDALLVVDTGTWSQLPGLQERVSGWPRPKLVIDHHLTQEDWADARLVVTEAAAAGEIAAELLDQWQVPMTPALATALFLAIASDTGWFQFSNTRPYTMRLAAGLMEAGVDTDRMYQLIYQNEKANRLALQTRAQLSLELLQGDRLAIMKLRSEDFRQTGSSILDTENLINIPMQIRNVEVSVLMVEGEDGQPVRVSLRSKGGLDVARFAEQFGGGGHARAAGLKLAGPLAQARDRIVPPMLAKLAALPPAAGNGS